MEKQNFLGLIFLFLLTLSFFILIINRSEPVLHINDDFITKNIPESEKKNTQILLIHLNNKLVLY
jgi:hypothetical protein